MDGDTVKKSIIYNLSILLNILVLIGLFFNLTEQEIPLL